MAELMSLEGVTKHFLLPATLLSKLIARERDRVVHAVNGVTLSVTEHETLGLVGESGSGKSTLGRVAIRLADATGGRITYQGHDITRLSGRDLRTLRQDLQIVFQNPYASLNPRKNVRQIVGAALEARGVTSVGAQEREIRALLKRVSLPERFMSAYPHQLSGGQRQRVSILRTLAVRPKLVVADEPVSALDVSVQAQILRLLQELKEEYGLTYVFIAHDLRVVHNICDRVAVMYLGKVVEFAGSGDLFREPLHPYTSGLLEAIPRLDRRDAYRDRIVLTGTIPSPLAPPGGCAFHTRCPVKIGRVCEEHEPPMREARPGHMVACHLYDLEQAAQAGERTFGTR